MTIIEGYFDELHFTECNFENFEFIKNNLIIYISSGLEIYGDHPLSDKHNSKEPCKVIFANVVFSRRSMDEYTSEPKFNGFKEERIIVDQLSNSKSVSINYDEYSIEGVLENPKSWLTWDIIAENFYLDDLKG